MTKNVGTTDRILRIGLSVVFIALALSTNLTTTIKVILILLAIVFALTSIIGFCPIYGVCKFDSRKIDPLERKK
ncbi:MAG: DUF2892 domain-containing protein [candidate division WOR-3 bacterium]